MSKAKDLPLASKKQEYIDGLGNAHEWTNAETCVKGNLMVLDIVEVDPEGDAEVVWAAGAMAQSNTSNPAESDSVVRHAPFPTVISNSISIARENATYVIGGWDRAIALYSNGADVVTLGAGPHPIWYTVMVYGIDGSGLLNIRSLLPDGYTYVYTTVEPVDFTFAGMVALPTGEFLVEAARLYVGAVAL